MSFWSLSPGRPLKIGGNIFSLGGGSTGPGPGASNLAAAACIAATNWAKKAAPVGGGPGGSASPTGPTGPGGPGGGGGGGGGGGASPPSGPLAPSPGGTGAAISNTQCNNKLNPTLLINSQSIKLSPYLLPIQASWSLVCPYRLTNLKRPWSSSSVGESSSSTSESTF